MGFILKIAIKILALFLSILFTLWSPLFICLVYPIFIFRYMISKLSLLVKPSLGKMVTSRSTPFALDNLYVRPKNNLACYCIIKGEVCLEKITNVMQTKIVDATFKNGHLKYPELKQYISSWMGFLYWKWDPNFNIANHIKYWEPEGKIGECYLDDKEIKEIYKHLIVKPHIKGRSPWSLTIIRNIHPKNEDPGVTYSGIILIFHHGMCDAFSGMEVFGKNMCGQGIDTLTKAHFRKRSFFETCLMTVSYIIRAPYEFIHQNLESIDINDWHIPENKLSNMLSIDYTEPKPLSYFKEIRDIHKVSVSTVLLTGICGGIRSYMLKKEMKVPEKMHFMLPIPIPNHPEHLRNYMSLGNIALPVGCKSPTKRMKIVHRSFEALRISTIPRTTFIIIKFVGSLFHFMTKHLAKNYFTTGIMTNVPGFQTTMQICGYEVIDNIVGGGLGPGRTGMAICTYSYMGKIKICAGFDKSIFPTDEDVTELLQCIEQEYEILRKSGDGV